MMIACRLFSVLSVLYLQVLPSWEDNANFLKTDELLVEAARRFSKLFDDVDEIKEDISAITDQLSDGGYRGPNKTGAQPIKTDGARVTIAQINETTVEILVDHNWENLVSARWLSDSRYILLGEPYPQFMTEYSVSILLPLEQVKNSSAFPGPNVSLYVLLGQSFYAFVFDIPSALKSENKTFETGTTYGELREALEVFPVDVTPSDVISYTPGDEFVIELKPRSKNNIEGGSGHFYSISSDPDESVVISIRLGPEYVSGPYQNNPFSFPNRSEPIIKVDSSSLRTGGLIYVIMIYGSRAESVRNYITMKMISLQLQNANSPIPEGRVAILSEFYQHQTIRLDAEKGHISCEALGNPPPNLHIRINGLPVHTRSAFWSYPVGSMLTVYDIPAERLIRGPVTCYANNAGDDAEMAIVVTHEIREVQELNKMRLLEGDRFTEGTCAFEGNPAPNITIYKDYVATSNVVSQEDDGVEITYFQEGFLSEATVLFDLSVLSNVWGMACVARNGEQVLKTQLYVG